ncbi:MAG: ATP-binding protein [Bacillota bacterium]|jgi:two-component system chemotaxis sensor kinase CheA
MEHMEDLTAFLEEVDELLANTEQNLVELEKSPSGKAIIQEIFRAMHTIKGGAATLGLQDGVEVTHATESILDTIRSGQRALTREITDLLFSVLDWLSSWKAALESGSERPPIESIMAQIHGIQGARPGADETGEDAATSSEDVLQVEDYREGEGSFTPDPDLARQIAEKLKQGEPVYKLTVSLDQAELLSVRCFQLLVLVGEEAEIIGSVPSAEKVEAGEVGDALAIYLTSDDGGESARRAAESVQDVIQVSLVPYELPTQEQAGRQAGQGARGHGPTPGGPESPDAQEDSGSDSLVRTTNLGRTVRVNVALLDLLLNLVGELVIDRTRLSQLASRLQANTDTAVIGNEVAALSARLQRTSQELQEGIMKARLLPLRSILSKFPRMVRDLSSRCGKLIDFEIRGERPELDRTVLEAIDDPLIHILRNAVDHGIEMPEERKALGKPERGRITLSAWYQENQVLIRIRDDGRGIDPDRIRESAVNKGIITREAAARLSDREALELIFTPGFSTAREATEVSGRGVGMDVVKSNLERVNGHIEIKSQVGVGTSATLRLPLTLAIVRALLVECSGITYAIPTPSVEEVLAVRRDDVKTIKGKAALTVRGRVFPLVSLEGCLKDDPWMGNGKFRYAVLTRTHDEPLALGVDRLIGEEEIVVKELGRILSRIKGIGGATILPQGDPAVILDTNTLLWR